jgi:hypothetical protein
MSTGQIHDLGYKRYVGTRTAVETRWTVIMRHQLSTAWRGWWRFKPWLIAAMMATAISGGVLYFLSGNMFRALRGVGGNLIRFADGILPISMTWYSPIGFIVSLTVCASLVSGDMRSGAFTFYFARSVRPRDYVLGKLAGLLLLLSLIMLGGPLVLAGVRLGLSDDTHQLIELLPVMYKALAVGALGTLIFAAVPFGFSALVVNPRYAMAAWAAYYIVIGVMAQGIGYATRPEIAAIDLTASLKMVAANLFDLHFGGGGLQFSTAVALASIGAQVAAAIAVVFWRVRSAQQAGVGGSS